jgi:GT2 family glycosyltransferase
MRNFAFIVLHYNKKALPDTFECVDSILKINHQKHINIVIVDNGSKDGSFREITLKYKKDKNVKVIENNTNEGYAKGNNFGANYARKMFDPDFICIINNDTIIKQDNLLNLILKEYEESEFHIMGPRIISKQGYDQNPMRINFKDIADIEKKIIENNELLKNLYKKFSIKVFIMNSKKILRKIKPIRFMFRFLRKLIANEVTEVDYKDRKISVQLYGAALIFSRTYIEKYNYIFYPKTFLYHEEDILHYITVRDNLTTIYNPNIEISHKEDVSTDFLVNGKNKAIFLLKHSNESLIAFKELIKNSNIGGEL